MIARLDESELLVPLYDGLYEEPRWHTFLLRLKGRTNADYAGLIFRQGDAPMHEATEVFAGRDVRTAARLNTPGDLYRLDPIPYNDLQPGIVYRADEMMNPDDPQHERFRREYLEKIGLRFGRFVRVIEPSGASVWLMINREASDFGAAEAALLRSLAPHVGIALRMFAELERGRQRAVIGANALTRCGVGWIALDREARLVDADKAALNMLQEATQHEQQNGTRLSLQSPEAGRLLVRASAVFDADDQADPRLIRLSDHPRLDLLAIPMRHRPLVALALPTLIGFLRGGEQLGERHVAMFAQAYGLSSGEARVALAICQGRTIRDAALELGLTFETARSYSKRVYAKTGTRGQGDLVREILTSVIKLA